MGVKYSIEYKDSFDQSCRLDISTSLYDGSVISVVGVEGSACTISYDCGDGGEDIYEPIVNSKAEISLWQTVGSPVDITELQNADDRDFVAELYIQNSLKWKGFIVPDGIKQIFQQEPYQINLIATDGIKLMDGIDYTPASLDGGALIINYYRQILFASANLGLNLPIRWVSSLTNPEFPATEDIISEDVKWAVNGEGLTDDNGKKYSCLYLLTELTRSLQCRLFQSDGYWNLERVNDIVDGEFTVRETSGLGTLIITQSDVNVIKTIAKVNSIPCDYNFIDEDAVLTNIPSVKKVSTTYEQNQRQNVIPNGSMDLVDTITNTPYYWGGTGLLVTSVPSLSDASGYAAQVENVSGDVNYIRVSRPPSNVPTVIPGVRFEIAFYFKGVVKTGDVIFLTDKDLDSGAEVNNYGYIIPPLYNNNTFDALTAFAQDPAFFEEPTVEYDVVTGEYKFAWIGQNQRIAGRQVITLESAQYFSFDGLLPIDTDILYAYINFGFKFLLVSGVQVDASTGLIDWENTQNSLRITYNSGLGENLYLNEFGFWVASPTDIQITVPQLQLGDVAQVDFNNFQNIVMPLPAIIPIGRTNYPQINVRFNIPPGRKVVFDDVYINVNDNHDLVEASFGTTTTNTKTESYSLAISSGHSGFHLSSYMTSYSNSGEEKIFADDKFSGTLTAINSNAILRNRYKSSILFEGSIYGRLFSYGEIYNIETLDNKNFLPLAVSWNTETNTISLTCAEVRNDDIEIEMNYTSTSNKSTSN